MISYVLQDLEKEYQRQAFYQSKMPDGAITAVKFAEIMKVLRGHKLSPFVRNYLLTVRVDSFVLNHTSTYIYSHMYMKLCNRGVPLLSKFGNLLISEILIMTSAYGP